MSLSSEIPGREAYTYWYRRPAYLARSNPDNSEIQHYDPPSQSWKVEDRIRYIEWLSHERVEVAEDFVENFISQCVANWSKYKKRSIP